MTDRPTTLGELVAAGYTPKTVKDEIRDNLIATLKRGENVFPGILGYEKTVVPALQNAILARHDFILLGLRGQAKTRILRSLVEPPRRGDARRRGLRAQRVPFAPFTPRPPHGRHGGTTTCPSPGFRARTATARSSRRRTSRSPTSSATSIRSRPRRSS